MKTRKGVHIKASISEPLIKEHIKKAVAEAAECIEREARDQWPTVEPSWMERVRRMIRGENDN